MDRRFVRGLAGMALGAALVLPFKATAQYTEAPPPPAYALENLTVVHADGTRESGVTVVVRNGLIEAMGSGVSVPADATVLAGDSLYMYPGLVDANGSAGVEFPEIERPDDMRSWDAPRAVQGMLAHRRVVDHLDHDSDVGEDHRKVGVVAAGAHATGGLAAGQGAAVVFRGEPQSAWDLVGVPALGLNMSFQAASGAYPSQLFGVIAYIRQAFEDANRAGLWQSAYASDPEGMTMPRYDADYEVLRMAAAGQMPVFFSADIAEDIRRVLMLSDEYGFRPIIVGGNEAWKVADQLAARGIPVLLDVDFRNPTRWKPDDEEQTELEPDAEREKTALEEAYSNAGLLARAGVQFALTSGGEGGDLRPGVRKTIEYGLPEDAALAAITSTPAAMLGMPALARLEEGMAATFVIMDKPIFEEGSNVNYTFVEGWLERGREPGATVDPNAPVSAVGGTWTMTVNAAGQEIVFDMDLTQDGNSISGSGNIPDAGPASIAGTVSGNVMDFTLTISAGGQSIELTASGNIEGNSMTGTGSSPFGEFTFSGTRNPGGAR